MKTIDFNDLKTYASTLGISEIGHMPATDLKSIEPFYEERLKKSYMCHLEQNHSLDEMTNVSLSHPDGLTFIAILIPVIFHHTDNDLSKGVYLSMQGRSYDYHIVVKEQLSQLSSYLDDLGVGSTILCDTHPYPERFIAKEAGLGIIGKNSYLINQTYGPGHMIGLLLIDASISGRLVKETQDYCDGCTLCIKACPNQAIVGGRQINSNKCIAYMTQKKELTSEEMSLLNNNLYGCDVCAVVCPYTKNDPRSSGELVSIELVDTDRQYNDSFELDSHFRREAITNINNKAFKQNLKPFSLGWIGKKRLQRNTIISMRYEMKYKQILENLLEDSRPDIVEAARDSLNYMEHKNGDLG